MSLKHSPRLQHVIGLVLAATTVLASQPRRPAQEASPSPADLVRKTVDNEIKAAKTPGNNFMFRSRKQLSWGSQTRIFVQTREATAAMLVAINDQGLTPQQRQTEEGRLRYLIKNPDELKRKQKQERDDAERVTRIMRALPDAFLYEYENTDKGSAASDKKNDELVRLKFRPNPKYNPPSRVEQVLSGMQGFLLIDSKQDRIAEIDGTLFKDVSFGWGILGHLDKGGHFQVEQADVGDGTWAITRMRLSFTGKVFLFKNIAIKNDEVFSDFRKVPSNLSFAEGVALLEKEQPAREGKSSEQGAK
jgi:hypothetical protein